MASELSADAADPGSHRESDEIVILRPTDARSDLLTGLDRKCDRFRSVLVSLRHTAFSPTFVKSLDRRWRVGEVADQVGRTSQYIRTKEKSGDLPPPPIDKRGRRIGYDLDSINRIRDFAGARPCRGSEDEPAVVAFSSFKGGCGKSTLSVHFAQYLALRGYHVLFIDVDPQASATTLFGLNPDYEDPVTNVEVLDSDVRLEDFLAGETEEFGVCVRPSYFPGIDIVPAGMNLNNAEYFLAGNIQSDNSLWGRLRDGITQVWHNYDVVVLDPPPALGFLSISVLNAANALVTPMRPTTVDFASTSSFMDMLRDNVYQLTDSDWRLPIYYHFHTILINDFDRNVPAQREICDSMRKIFGAEDLCEAVMVKSAAIDSASKEMKTVYDLSDPLTDPKTHKRCLSYLDAFCAELENRIRRIWPSHQEDLREQAVI